MRVKNRLKLSMLVMLGFLTANVMAGNTPHTWHTVSSNSGTWDAKLQMINEGGSFVTRDGSSLSSFTIGPGYSQDYGFIYDPGSDFNIAYTLTLTEQGTSPQFTSKACVYVITANGPAQPDIRPSSYQGAECNWLIVPGVGENFTVS